MRRLQEDDGTCWEKWRLEMCMSLIVRVERPCWDVCVVVSEGRGWRLMNNASGCKRGC